MYGSACSAALFISSALILSSVAIWSMKAPVPPAQLPFMRTSVPLVRNRIFASSPPSSMTQSVAGTNFLTATRVENTSCTKGTPQLSARPMPAEPEMLQQRFPAVQLLCVDAAQQLLRLFQNVAVMALIRRI